MKNVLLVFGGKSYEHDISIVTASQIFNKTNSEKFNLLPIYISRENRFFAYVSREFNLADFKNRDGFSSGKKFKEIVFVSSEKNVLFQKTIFGLKEFAKVQNAVFACHGGVGENGELVAFFESCGIRCSSGNVDSLGVCMNKFLFKQVMKGMGVSVVSGFKINENDFDDAEYKRKMMLRLRFMKFPLVIKPVNGGSSIGLFVAENFEDFEIKLMQCFEFDEDVIVEKFVSNAKEFNVAVVGTRNDFEISEIDEPLKVNEVLSFEDKYLSKNKSSKKLGIDGSMVGQKRKFPAEIDDVLKMKIKFATSKIFKGLNLVGVVRIDFLYDEKSDKLYVCEVNSVPGSLAYYFFSNCKISVNKLVEKLIDVSDENFALKSKFNKDFVTNVL